MYSTRLSRLIAGLVLALTGGSAYAAFSDLNMPVGVTPISREAYDLHMLMLWICVVVGIIVFGVMFIAILKHRKSVGHEPAKFHHNTKAEVMWTVIPCIILVAFAIPATNALIDMENTSESEVTIKVTGYQWKWKYEYLEDGLTFYSNLADSSRAAIFEDPTAVEHYLLEVDEPVVLPAGKKVRLLLTADDVIHAWWVPDLGMKKDAIPGFINEMWIKIDEDKTGVYRGQCAELCGKDHGFMPIVVEARDEAGYKSWVAEMKAAMTAEKAAQEDSSSSAEAGQQAKAAVEKPGDETVQPSVIAAAPTKVSGGP